jgi:hypothetical protein
MRRRTSVAAVPHRKTSGFTFTYERIRDRVLTESDRINHSYSLCAHDMPCLNGRPVPRENDIRKHEINGPTLVHRSLLCNFGVHAYLIFHNALCL